MKKIIFVLITILLISCTEKKEIVNKDLAYFDSKFVAELGNENYDEFAGRLNNKIKPKYIDDLIYIHKLIEVNSCGEYSGDIKIKNDSIILMYNLTSDVVCTSTRVDKVTYIIKNPKNKKYKFRFKI